MDAIYKIINLGKFSMGGNIYNISIDKNKIDKYKEIRGLGETDILFGYNDPLNQEIVLSPIENKNVLKRTLMHEIIHSFCDYTFGDNYASDEQEKQIEVVAQHLVDFILSNKHIIKYFLNEKSYLKL